MDDFIPYFEEGEELSAAKLNLILNVLFKSRLSVDASTGLHATYDSGGIALSLDPGGVMVAKTGGSGIAAATLPGAVVDADVTVYPFDMAASAAGVTMTVYNPLPAAFGANKVILIQRSASGLWMPTNELCDA